MAGDQIAAATIESDIQHHVLGGATQGEFSGDPAGVGLGDLDRAALETHFWVRGNIEPAGTAQVLFEFGEIEIDARRVDDDLQSGCLRVCSIEVERGVNSIETADQL